jgi:hypothetical protein
MVFFFRSIHGPRELLVQDHVEPGAQADEAFFDLVERPWLLTGPKPSGTNLERVR